MDKKEIRDRIANYEAKRNGLHQISGAWVKPVNVLIRAKAKTVIADVVMYHDEGPHQERFNDLEYSFKELGIEEAN